MGSFKSFEDIEAWQKARSMTKKIYEVSGQNAFAKDFSLKDQIRRASVSTMSNIAEGFGRGGSREFLQFLSIAKGSATEVESHLIAAMDQGYIRQKDFDELKSIAQETIRMIGGLMGYLKKSELRGAKFK